MTFNIRAEFTNIFNRTEMANPSSTNAGAAQTRTPAGQPNAGFGWINTFHHARSAPARWTMVGRFQW